MPNGVIDIEDFERNTDVDWKLNVLFKTLIHNIEVTEKRFDAGKQRFEKLEKRKMRNSFEAAAGGILGGIIATLGIKWGGLK